VWRGSTLDRSEPSSGEATFRQDQTRGGNLGSRRFWGLVGRPGSTLRTRQRAPSRRGGGRPRAATRPGGRVSRERSVAGSSETPPRRLPRRTRNGPLAGRTNQARGILKTAGRPQPARGFESHPLRQKLDVRTPADGNRAGVRALPAARKGGCFVSDDLLGLPENAGHGGLDGLRRGVPHRPGAQVTLQLLFRAPVPGVFPREPQKAIKRFGQWPPLTSSSSTTMRSKTAWLSCRRTCAGASW
jgi:hypothetical protein